MLIGETGDMERVEKELGSGAAPAVLRLRGFTNYLTPQDGIFTADTWAGIILYLRNLIINWTVFAPAFLLVTLIAVMYRSILYALHEYLLVDEGLLLIGTLLLAFAASRACAMLPSHRVQSQADFVTTDDILQKIIVPALSWAFLVPFLIEYDVAGKSLVCEGQTLMGELLRIGTAPFPYIRWLVPGSYTVAMLAGYLAAWSADIRPDASAPDLYKVNVWRWLAATLLVTAMIAVGLQLILPCGALYIASLHPFTNVGPLMVNAPTAVAMAMPVGLISAHLLQTTFYVAFRREGVTSELDREWLARASGLALRVGVAAVVWAICCLILPPLLNLVTDITAAGDLAGLWKIMGAGGVTVAIGGPTAWLGKKLAPQIEALAAQSGKTTTWLLNGLAVTFAVALLTTSSALLQFSWASCRGGWRPRNCQMIYSII